MCRCKCKCLAISGWMRTVLAQCWFLHKWDKQHQANGFRRDTHVVGLDTSKHTTIATLNTRRNTSKWQFCGKIMRKSKCETFKQCLWSTWKFSVVLQKVILNNYLQLRVYMVSVSSNTRLPIVDILVHTNNYVDSILNSWQFSVTKTCSIHP